MSIDRAEVARIAELARLEIPEGEVDRLAGQLSQVLDFAATIRQLDLAGCEPTVFAPSDAPMRDDVADGRRLTPEKALEMAPQAEHGFFLVPPIVENVNP
jgi:aspartyl-tRNA(Asn)/glutamyl-tRNA(Gln) amidotransferase subunit C